MVKYFYLQLKRLLKLFPFALCIAAILFGSGSAVYLSTLEINANSETQNKFPVGLVGTAGDTYLELGLAALETMDTTRFSIEIQKMTEEQAYSAMHAGKISAYFVIPEDFINQAFHGNLLPIQFVSTKGATGMVSIFKDEIAQVIEGILVHSQRGIFGVGNALWANGQGNLANTHVNALSIDYVESVLDRGKIYTARELGISDGLGLDGYLLCGLSTLFLLLICIPFAPVLIRRDWALPRMLSSRRISPLMQVFGEFSAFFLGLLALAGVVVCLVVTLGLTEQFAVSSTAIWQLLPVVLTAAAMNFFLFELSKDFISGILLPFVAALALCFLSGCLYPIYFFPKSVQMLSVFLPTGAARIQLAGCLTGVTSLSALYTLIGYSAAFLLGAYLLRYYRVSKVRG